MAKKPKEVLKKPELIKKIEKSLKEIGVEPYPLNTLAVLSHLKKHTTPFVQDIILDEDIKKAIMMAQDENELYSPLANSLALKNKKDIEIAEKLVKNILKEVPEND